MSRHQTGFSTEGAGVELVPFPIGDGGGNQAAAEVPYDNTASGLTADDVQEALDEIASSPPGSYTDEDARDAIGVALVDGAGITITVDDGANTITIACTITQYTDGMADARVAAGIATHEAAPDPHPGYLTPAEGNSAYQALSANLTEYAAVNPTAAGLALLDDADATAQRTTLGLGTAALNNTGDFAAALGADDNYATDAEKVKLANLSGTNTGDQTLPVKATGAEVDTGTDDAKFLTPKAIEDSAYVKAAAVTAAIAATKIDDLTQGDDNTDLDSSTSRHGLLKKLPGGTTTFLRGDGAFAAPPAGSANVGTATLDFGAFPGASDASVAVTGQAGIVAGSIVNAWLRPAASADHTADEHMVETLKVIAGNIIAGTGFTIYGFNTSQLNEPLEPAAQSPDFVVAAAATTKSTEQAPRSPIEGVGGIGTRLYGQWTCAWSWN